MRKPLLIITLSLLLSNLIFGQVVRDYPNSQRKLTPEVISKLNAKRQARANANASRDIVNTLTIDYGVVDNFNQGADGPTYGVSILNNRNDDSDIFGLSFAGVKFIELVGYDVDGVFVDEITYASNYELLIDSIYTTFFHDNITGQEDTLVVEVHRFQSSNSNFSNNPTILWADTIRTTTSINDGEFFEQGWETNITVPVGRRCGVTIKYFAPKLDTLRLLGSHAPDPNDGILESSTPHSITRLNGDSQFLKNIDLISISTGTPPDTNRINVQNWDIFIKARINEVLDIEKVNGIQMGHAYPNPFTDVTNFTFNLDKSAEIGIQIFDVTGKLVLTESMGKKSAGKNNVSVNAGNLPSGLYMYRITADGEASVSKKVTLVR